MEPTDDVTSLREDRGTDDRALDTKIDTQSDDPDTAATAIMTRLGLTDKA